MFGEIFQIEKILGVCDRILCICAFQKDVCFSLLFYKSDHRSHAFFRWYDCKLSGNDKGADVKKYHMGFDPAFVYELF